MVTTGFDIERKIRAARARLKGQRAGRKEAEAVRIYADLIGLRDLYRTTVHARFDLDTPTQTSIAVAIAYAKNIRGRARARLWAQIAEAKRVKVDLPWNHDPSH
jgi:hypothetical protein